MSDTEWRAYLFVAAPAVVVLAVGPALSALAPRPGPVTPGPLRWVGVPAVLAGLGLVAWAVHTFARAGEAPSPADGPDRLVTGGPLTYTRNPVYLGTVLAAAGESVVLASSVLAGYAGTLWAVYHLLAVYREEPELRATFGDAYEAYSERVPRWF